MRFEEVFALAMILALAACPDEPQGPPPKRFDAVKRESRSAKAAEVFCEKTFTSGARKWTAPPEQPVPSVSGAPAAAGWRWINFWASWCTPCLEEMPLLSRWKETLDRDGVSLSFELWSVDDDRAAFEGALRSRDRFPAGGIHWLRSSDDLPSVLESLGVEKDSAIPIHALVDPSGDLRCVRVGAVGENDFGTVKTIIGG